MRPPLLTTKAELRWSHDGRTITKRVARLAADELLGDPRRAFDNEARVGMLLRSTRVPVPTAHLLAVDRHHRTLTFEAVDGEPLGPKFPERLPPGDVEDLLALVNALARFRPRRRWLRRFPLEQRLHQHVAAGIATAADAEAIAVAAAPDRNRWSFAHGDLTARNVLRAGTGQLVLIDWEWAGVHPPRYDQAFLWFSLAHDEAARRAVAADVPEADRSRFLVSLVMIQLLHLQMWRARGRPPTAFEVQHEQQHRLDLEELQSLSRAML